MSIKISKDEVNSVLEQLGERRSEMEELGNILCDEWYSNADFLYLLARANDLYLKGVAAGAAAGIAAAAIQSGGEITPETTASLTSTIVAAVPGSAALAEFMIHPDDRNKKAAEQQ